MDSVDLKGSLYPYEEEIPEPKNLRDLQFVSPPKKIVGEICDIDVPFDTDMLYNGLYHTDDPDWDIWLEICRYTGWGELGPLQPIRYHGFIMPHNATQRVNTNFYNELMHRYNSTRPIRIAVVGEAGMGKSYMAIHIARILCRDRFTIDRIAFEAEDYIRMQDDTHAGSKGKKPLKLPLPCIIEEPAYIMAAREWQKAEQKESIKVIETTRYKNIPLIFPVVNRGLLDKIVREYYINYVVEMKARGIGAPYFTYRRQWETFTRRKSKGRIFAYWPGVELARCGRDTCLRCPELPTCNKYIWPKYERKRADVLERRRKEGLEQDEKEAEIRKGVSIRDQYSKALEMGNTIMGENGKYSVPLIQYHLDLNRTTAQTLKKLLEELPKQTPIEGITPP